MPESVDIPIYVMEADYDVIDLYGLKLTQGRSFSTPVGPVKGRTATLVRVYTDDGRVGTGSAYAHPGMVQAAIDHLTPLLIGRDVLDPADDPVPVFVRGGDAIAGLWRLMYLYRERIEKRSPVSLIAAELAARC